MQDAELPDELRGAVLVEVHELLFDPADEPGPPAREAVALQFGGRALIMRALTDTSELSVCVGALDPETPDYTVRNVSSDHRFAPFVGKPLHTWWFAKNDAGYSDTFIAAFGPSQGLLFVAMNNEVSVLQVSGEQFA